MDLLGRLAVHLAFRDGDAMKDRDGFLFYPIAQATPPQQGTDVTEVAPVMMFMAVLAMAMLRFVFVMMMSMPVGPVLMMMLMFMMMVMFSLIVPMFVIVVVICRMHIELHAFDAALLRSRAMEMVAVEFERQQSALEIAETHPQVEQRSDKHIAADPAERIKVKRFHSSSPAARALIWLAA
jgi:hypothetical protein